jgi:poly-gamma-glutamate capsule biosynthesis protein CapA/YwtB (metallophosphatase superfamily)
MKMKGAVLRDRVLIVLCSVAATAMVAATVGDFQAHGDQRPDVIDVWLPPTADANQWSLQFVGDTMVGDAAQPMLDAFGDDSVFAGVAPLLDGNLVIANAEAPISNQTVPLNPGKAYSYNSNPLVAPAMRKAGVDVLGLGNNHSMDMGVGGLAETMKWGAESGLVAFGAGANLAQAERPLLVHSSIGTVGIVSLGERFGADATATMTHPGTVAFSPETVQRGVDLARAAGADWVIADVHWGDNYVDTNEQQHYWARQMVAAGYDLIIGTGPHIVAPIEYIGNVPVIYSIGNFVFGAPGRYAGFSKPGVGLLLSIIFRRDATAQFLAKCIVTDNMVTNYVAPPCSPEQSAATMLMVNPGFIMEGANGRMECNCLAPVTRSQ